MGVALAESFPVARAVFEEASEAVGQDLLALCRDTDDDTLRLTQNAQIALFTCGLAAWSCIRDRFQPVFFAGHSVGEYAAVVAAGALSIGEGAKLIQRRGELMAAARAGAMAAILGMDREPLQEVLNGIDGVVVIANDNCPGQLVISGSPEAVAAAGEAATSAGAKRALPLNVSGAFHSPLMADAAREMRVALDAAAWQVQRTPVVANVHAGVVQDSAEWPSLLERQLESSVLWTGCVQTMRAGGVEKFVECGSGEVLTGLLKRIDREATGVAVQDPDSVEKV